MTDTRETLRAVFLAAIMALSMVAMGATFAGAAAAQPTVDDTDRVIEDAELAPGESTTVTVTAEFSEEADNIAFGGDFDPVVESASFEDADPFPDLQDFDEEGYGIVFSDEASVEYTYEVTIPEDGVEDGDTFTFDSDVALDPGDDEAQIAGDDTITVVTDEPEADFQIADVDPSDDVTVDQGEEVEVGVTVENAGDAEGTQDAEFVLDDETVDSEELTLGEGDEETVTLSATAPDEDAELPWFVQTEDDQSATWTLTVGDGDDDEEVDPDDTVDITGWGAEDLYAGQVIEVDVSGTDLDADETVDIRRVTDFDGGSPNADDGVGSFTVTADETLLIRTERLGDDAEEIDGEYVLRTGSNQYWDGTSFDGNLDESVDQEIDEQDLTTLFVDEDGDELDDVAFDGQADLFVDSFNRQTWEGVLYATLDGDSLDEDELAEILPAETQFLDEDDLEDFDLDPDETIGFDGDVEGAVLVDTGDEETIDFDFASDDFEEDGDLEVGLESEDAIASDGDNVTIREEVDLDIDITGPDAQVEQFVRGDIVPVSLDLEGTDTATVTIGDSSNNNVELNVTVRDGDESGDVTFVVNTYELGDETAGPMGHGVYVANEFDDEAELVDVDAHTVLQTGIGGGSAGEDVIDSGSYAIVVSDGEEAWTAEDQLVQDRSSLRLNERGTEGVEVWTAPGSGAAQIEPETTDDIAEYIEEGLITPADGTIADEDYFLIQVQSSGLEGVIHNEYGDFDFLDFEDDQIVTDAWFDTGVLTAFGLQSDAGPNLDGFAIDMESLTQADAEAEVIAGADDATGSLDEFFIPVPLESGDDATLQPDRPLEAPEDMLGFFEVAPPIDAEYFATGANTNPAFTDIEAESIGGAGGSDTVYELDYLEVASSPFTFVDDRAHIVDRHGAQVGVEDVLDVPQEDNVTVQGTTNIAAGTLMNVNLDVPETGTFTSNTVEVEYVEGAPNTWETQFDFSQEPVNTEINLNIRRSDTASLLNPQEESTSGIVSAPAAVEEFEFNDQESGGSTVLVDSFNTTQGGFIGIYDADGERLGQTDRLDRGQRDRIAVSLDEDLEENQELTATAYRTEDNPYVEDGEPVQRTAEIIIEDLDPAEFTVSDLEPQTAELEEPGPAVEVSATITNDGDEAGTQDVEVQIDGETVDSESVTLEGDESTTVSFEVDTGDLEFDESYTHAIVTEDDEASGVLTIDAEDTPTPEPADDDDDETPEPPADDTDDADDDGAGFGVVVALLAFLGAALLAVRRQTRE